jgi:hypothetical protein
MTTSPQTVTCAVPFRRRGRRRTEAPTSPPEVAPEVPAGRVPRLARLMQGTIAITRAVRRGSVAGELARRRRFLRERLNNSF